MTQGKALSGSRVVVVGSGAAGLAVVENLRRLGHRGPIEVLSAESGPPYDRPPLSKEVLAADWPPERARLRQPDRLAELEATWHHGRSAIALDPEARQVLTDDASLPYDAVVIATGVRPRQLPMLPPTARPVHTLRTMRDCLRLREALIPNARLLVVGGGFLGLEVAATACRRGVEVTVVEADPQPLASRLGAAPAADLLRHHARTGVRVYAGTTVEHAEIGPHSVRLFLAGGTELHGDAVLVAAGSVPNSEWLRGSGIDITDGVRCDETCSVVDGVWAAGDVARWWHPGVRRYMRLEHRMNANEQGRVVAANILGAGEAFCPVPFFWSTHGDVRVHAWGLVPSGIEATEVWAGDDGDSRVWTFSSENDGPIVAAVGWNAPRRTAEFRDRIHRSWTVHTTVPASR